MIKKLIFLLIIMLIITSCAETTNAVDGIDLDLTELSMIMVYSEVNNIYAEPAKYMGKTIKVGGTYGSEYYDQTDLYYHYVLFEDATACCTSGIEFIWTGDHNYPSDYPDEGDFIEICGQFNTYNELGMTYYYLSVNEIIIK